MSKTRLIYAIPLGIFMAGCTDFEAAFDDPTINLPDRYSLVAPVSKPKPENLEWWRTFKDPVLDRLIQQGLTDNLSIAEARARVREAQADARGAGVVFSGSGSVDYQAISGVGDSTDIGLSVNTNLAGQPRYASRAALARLAAAELDTVDAKRIVLSQVATAYADLRFFQTSRTLLEKDLTSRRRTLRDINTQLDAGEATRLDVLRAQSLLAETETLIPQVEAQIVQSRNSLSTLLGKPVGLLGVDLTYQGRQLHPGREIAVGVPADLLRKRPDIRRAERLYAAAVSDVGTAEAARYPSLRLTGEISIPTDGGSVTESLISGLVLPVFDQPALKANADAARARVEQAYLQWRVAVLAAVEEVENAQVLLKTALQSMRVAERALRLDTEALNISRELVIGGGNTTVLDVLDRERTLSASRSALAQTTRDAAAAYIALQVAVGQGHPLTAQPDINDSDEAEEVVTQLDTE